MKYIFVRLKVQTEDSKTYQEICTGKDSLEVRIISPIGEIYFHLLEIKVVTVLLFDSFYCVHVYEQVQPDFAAVLNINDTAKMLRE